MLAPVTRDDAAFTSLRTLLDERWTCRAFLPDEVPEATVEELLAAAQRSASWCNTQPWQVDVVSGPALVKMREALMAHVLAQPQESDFGWPTSYPGTYGDRRRACGYQLYASLGIERSDQEARLVQMLRNFEFFGAPHVAIVTAPADLGTWGALDCGLWLQSFLLGAQALGLGAAPQAALAGYAPFFRSHLGLSEDRNVVVGVSFGFPDEAAPVNTFRTARAELGEAVTFHR